MNRTPGEVASKIKIDKKRDITYIRRKENTSKLQYSVIVKMAIDGHTIKEIAKATGVTNSFVASTKQRFGITRPNLADEKTQIRKILMESPDFTHKVSTISKLTGYRNTRISHILSNMPQAERGEKKGLYSYYKYNFDISIS